MRCIYFKEIYKLFLCHSFTTKLIISILLCFTIRIFTNNNSELKRDQWRFDKK